MNRKERFIKKLEDRKKFFKEEEEGYPETVVKMSIFTLELEYYAFKLAIEENVRDLDEAYTDYINNEIDNIALNYEVTDAKMHIDHWQNMQEIVLKELLKKMRH